MSHDGVHATHCCVEHGCKYCDEDCPVVTRQIKQEYPCEDCSRGFPVERRLDEFVALMRADIDRFEAHWRKLQQEAPTTHPSAMWSGEWDEQFRMFIENDHPC